MHVTEESNLHGIHVTMQATMGEGVHLALPPIISLAMHVIMRAPMHVTMHTTIWADRLPTDMQLCVQVRT